MSEFKLRAGDLDRQITIQRKVKPAGAMSAGQVANWIDVATDIWAQVQEMLPSRGERLVEGLRIALRPARVRIRYRPDIDASMRILYAGRTLQIMAPPVELGRRVGLEMMAQDYSSSGGAQ